MKSLSLQNQEWNWHSKDRWDSCNLTYDLCIDDIDNRSLVLGYWEGLGIILEDHSRY